MTHCMFSSELGLVYEEFEKNNIEEFQSAVQEKEAYTQLEPEEKSLPLTNEQEGMFIYRFYLNCKSL